MVQYPQAAPKSSQRNHGLDFLRGLAALGVAVYHFLSWRIDFRIESLGLFGVYIFFVLSGLTMMIVYGRVFSEEISKDSLFSFFNHRIARIVPLLALVSLLSLLSGVVAGQASASAFIKFLLTSTGAFALQSPGFLSNTVGAWSLGIEGFFYMIFPAVALIAMNVENRKIGLTVAFLAAAQQAFLFLIRDRLGNTADHWILYIGPLTFAPFFLAGIYIFRQETLERRIRLHWSLLIFSLIVCFSLIFKVELKSNAFCYLTLSALSAASVWCAYVSKINHRMIWLCSFLGDVSYALYMTHWIAFAIVVRLSKMFALSTWLECAAFVCIALAGAYLTFIFFERPSRDFIRRYARY